MSENNHDTNKLIESLENAIAGLWEAINSLGDTIDKAKERFAELSKHESNEE